MYSDSHEPHLGRPKPPRVYVRVLWRQRVHGRRVEHNGHHPRLHGTVEELLCDVISAESVLKSQVEHVRLERFEKNSNLAFQFKLP